MKIIVDYYGAFRIFGKQTALDIEAPATVRAVKSALMSVLGVEHQALIEDSVLANETDILSDAFVLDAECTLSILPPVCGG